MYTLKDYYEEAGLDTYPEFAADMEMHHPSVPNFRPRWSQVTGLQLPFLFPNFRCALYDEQGTGKTLPSQAFAIWQAGVGNRAVVVMPPVLLGQYRDSFLETFTNFEKYVSLGIYHGTINKREKLLNEWSETPPDIVLTTYDMFRMEFAAFQDGYQCLIMDEARVLGNVENKTYRAIKAFLGGEGDKYCMVMNGTPAFTKLEDLFGYIDLVTPGVYRSLLQFQVDHINYKRIPVRTGNPNHPIRRVKTIESYSNIETLTRNLFKQARRVEKADVMEIPPKQFLMFPFNLGANHYSRYKQLVTEKVLNLEDGSMIDAHSSAGLREAALQCVVNPISVGIKSESTLFMAVEELVEETGIDRADNKIFLMAHHKFVVKHLTEKFKKYNPAVIYGDTANPQKEADKFKHDDTCRMAIVNYLSGGVGLNFQDVAHTAIAVEPTTSPGALHQAVDRLHRSGQKNKVTVYMMLPRGTLFRKAFKALAENQAWINQAVSPGALQDEFLGL